MAKSSIDTGEAAQAVHTRTTGATEESQAVVVAIDGSDDVVGADLANGLDVDVTRLPALPAGTNNIGDVDVLTLPALPAGTNNIGDVDVLSIVPGTGATSLGKAEDAVQVSGDTGVAVYAVRRDTAAVSAGTEGDYTTLNVDAEGQLWTRVGGELPAGGNNIGLVDIDAMPAAARSTDSLSAALATDVLMNNLTALTPKFAVIDFAGSGDNTLVAAVTSKKVRVHQAFLVAAAAVTIRFESGAGGTALTGQMNIAANQGFVLPFSPIGWFETASNTLLNLELSSAVSVDGVLAYTEV